MLPVVLYHSGISLPGDGSVTWLGSQGTPGHRPETCVVRRQWRRTSGKQWRLFLQRRLLWRDGQHGRPAVTWWTEGSGKCPCSWEGLVTVEWCFWAVECMPGKCLNGLIFCCSYLCRRWIPVLTKNFRTERLPGCFSWCSPEVWTAFQSDFSLVYTYKAHRYLDGFRIILKLTLGAIDVRYIMKIIRYEQRVVEQHVNLLESGKASRGFQKKILTVNLISTG